MPRFKIECFTTEGERRVYSAEALDAAQAARAVVKRGFQVGTVVEAPDHSKPPILQTPSWVWPVVIGAGVAVLGMVIVMAWVLLGSTESIINDADKSSNSTRAMASSDSQSLGQLSTSTPTERTRPRASASQSQTKLPFDLGDWYRIAGKPQGTRTLGSGTAVIYSTDGLMTVALFDDRNGKTYSSERDQGDPLVFFMIYVKSEKAAAVVRDFVFASDVFEPGERRDFANIAFTEQSPSWPITSIKGGEIKSRRCQMTVAAQGDEVLVVFQNN